MIQTRVCTRCAHVLPLEQFPMNRTPSGRSRPHSRCRRCRLEQNRLASKTPRGKLTKRRGILRREYGISVADYERLLKKQRGRCAICRKKETKRLRGVVLCLSVDHDHDTGAVRGLLCQACNVGLGSFRDNLKVLKSAVRYLKSPVSSGA